MIFVLELEKSERCFQKNTMFDWTIWSTSTQILYSNFLRPQGQVSLIQTIACDVINKNCRNLTEPNTNQFRNQQLSLVS